MEPEPGAEHVHVLANASGSGKRALRSEIAGKEVDVAKEELAATRRDVTARVRRAFYDLLRNGDELRIHHEQVASPVRRWRQRA